jgi:hypothetical protein
MSKQKPLQPVVRVAPPGELNAYVVFEHQLDALAQGSPTSLLLNFSLFFLGVSLTAFATLFSVPATSDRAYYTFLIIFLITGIAGAVLLVMWWNTHTSVKQTISEIKSQMPPNPEARNDPDNQNTADEGKAS